MSALPRRARARRAAAAARAPAGGSRRFARLEEDGDALGNVALVDCGEASPGSSAPSLEDVEAQVEAALAKARSGGGRDAGRRPTTTSRLRGAAVVRGREAAAAEVEVNVVADDGELYALD